MLNNQPHKPNPPINENPPAWRYYLLWLLIFAPFLVFWLSFDRDHGVERISYTQFKQAVRQDRVAEVMIKGQEVSGTYKEQAGKAQAAAETEQSPAPQYFETTLPSVQDPALLELLEEHDVVVRAVVDEPAWWQQLLVSLLPWILILGLIFYFSYRMQQRMMGGGGGQGGIFSFAKSRAKRFQKEKTAVTFEDVAGLENAKRELREIIDYLKDPRQFHSIGAKVPNGVLLMGPPGTGKTLFAKAMAGEAGVPFFSISGSEFIEMFVGVGASRVRDMFDAAKKESPAIIFIDELDSIGRARGAGLGGGHDEREQTLNQILSEMDGFAPHENVVVLAATNRPDVLDPALLRPGRFDRKITTELPNREARRKILEVHSRDMPLAEDVDLELTAQRTVGFSGADLENLINEAALLAGRERKERLSMTDLEQARDKLVLGAERETLLKDEDKRLIAYHESGHALAAWLLPEADPLSKVTIIPRGRALGATEQMPAEERYNLKRDYLLDRIGVMLGGRAAEKVIFGDITSGAESDLKQATQLAQRMVCQWGMSEKLGPVTFQRGEEHVFLGRELAQQQDFSEHTARLIDEEIHRIVSTQEQRDLDLLKEHRAKLDALAAALLESETVEAAEIEALFESADAESSRAAVPVN